MTLNWDVYINYAMYLCKKGWRRLLEIGLWKDPQGPMNLRLKEAVRVQQLRDRCGESSTTLHEG